MGFDLSKYLVIGISSRALFDLQTENEIFERDGIEAYSKFQIENEDKVLLPGAGFGLVRAILRLNQLAVGTRHSEVIVMSRNNADTTLRILSSIEHHKLDISRAAFTSGAPLAPYLKAFDVDLFLSADASDVQKAVDAGVAAARIFPSPPELEPTEDQIRVAFDGDAVLFSDASERIYQEEGLEAFLEHERQNAKKPLPAGPFAKLLKTLSFLQHELGGEPSPIRTALVTARNGPARERVIRTLRAWNVRIDEAFFLGGASKHGVLKAFGPHIFFDDQLHHLEPASRDVAVAQVPYQSAIQLELPGTPPAVMNGEKKKKKNGKAREAKAASDAIAAKRSPSVIPPRRKRRIPGSTTKPNEV